ncbi:ABC-type transport auxiliary lipoprotein family protein [Pusillimonas minor]|uniref:Membrane integrity-associated transporter subunit PqiC n=1 Tax=Pusillimonas minor TaxID=2697024 RepID=A0A842HMC2_9BURK|nr:ABC-type transport auxiliary lipoprotein family protein [Pusillimonas minor]MBC2769457.1 membrane integrity-associated transporter subunit PqiC [Pusillimonas minor]
MKRNRFLPLFFMSIATGLLTACSVLPEQAPVTVYQLPLPASNASSQNSAAANPASGVGAASKSSLISPNPSRTEFASIRINTPAASPTLNGTRILVSQAPYQVMAFQGVRWYDAAPRIVRNHVSQALKNGQQWQAVTTDDANVSSRYQLGGELHAFQVDAASNPRRVLVHIDATLVDTFDNKVIASQSFAISKPVPDAGFDSVIATFGEATRQLGLDIARWAAQSVAMRAPAQADATPGRRH